MNINQLQSTLEAVLFAAGEPVELSRLSQALEVEEETLLNVLENLAADLDERESGICLLRLENKFQLCARKQYAEKIRAVMDIKRNAPLSQAALEVLAVVAYNQPITKSFIEQVRGVDCSGVINSLCQKSLIEEKGRLDLPGRPLIYGTTTEFLRCFCISSLDELPPVSEGEKFTLQKTDENVESVNTAENVESSENDLPQKVDESKNLE